jgi:hydrogen peroxide-dependent heme synthase
MSSDLVVAGYPVYTAIPQRLLESDREIAVKEAQSLFDEWSERVHVRGVYSTAGFTANEDLAFWWVADSVDDIQNFSVAFRRTELGRSLQQTQSFLGIVRPAEFAKDHLPAFVKGAPPKKYFTVYPYVRTPEWYLLDADKRGEMLSIHGRAGREYPDVLANTTSAFGLGDYEWILAFEADSIDRLVDLIRRLRATEARRYTKLEVPFVTGIRKSLAGAVADLP